MLNGLGSQSTVPRTYAWFHAQGSPLAVFGEDHMWPDAELGATVFRPVP